MTAGATGATMAVVVTTTCRGSALAAVVDLLWARMELADRDDDTGPPAATELILTGTRLEPT